jgi:hypothetical protein
MTAIAALIFWLNREKLVGLQAVLPECAGSTRVLGKAPETVQFILKSLDVWFGANTQFGVGPPLAFAVALEVGVVVGLQAARAVKAVTAKAELRSMFWLPVASGSNRALDFTLAPHLPETGPQSA